MEHSERISIRQGWSAMPVPWRKKSWRKVGDVKVTDVISIVQPCPNVVPQIVEQREGRREIGLEHDLRSRAIANDQAALHLFETLQLRWQCHLNAPAGPAS
jgi:hypothetical protein